MDIMRRTWKDGAAHLKWPHRGPQPTVLLPRTINHIKGVAWKRRLMRVGSSGRAPRLRVQLRDVVADVDKGALTPKLVRRDWVLLATAHDGSLDIQGHHVGVAFHPPVLIRPQDSIFSPLGKGRLPMVFVFDRLHLKVVGVQLVPQKVARDFPFDTPALTNVLEVKHRRHVPQQRHIWIAGLCQGYMHITKFPTK